MPNICLAPGTSGPGGAPGADSVMDSHLKKSVVGSPSASLNSHKTPLGRKGSPITRLLHIIMYDPFFFVLLTSKKINNFSDRLFLFMELLKVACEQPCQILVINSK